MFVTNNINFKFSDASLWFISISFIIFISIVSKCKERLVVNGMSVKVKYVRANAIFIQSGTSTIPMFEVYADGQKCHPIVAGYASTIHKVMGQTLCHVTSVFDMRVLSPAIGYVPLSKVSSLCLPWITLHFSYVWEKHILSTYSMKVVTSKMMNFSSCLWSISKSQLSKLLKMIMCIL